MAAGRPLIGSAGEPLGIEASHSGEGGLDDRGPLGLGPLRRNQVAGIRRVVGVMGGYTFNVLLQHGTPGAYISSFTALAQLPDLWVGELKALIFGALAAMVASYKGLNPKGGPKGVGDAVNQSVIIAFMLLFVVNFIVTTVYFQVVPQKAI